MGNINYSLLKDFVVFTDIDPKTTYFLQTWDGLGFQGGDVSTGSPFGTIYNAPDVLVYNTASFTFIIDEDWKIFETIQNLAIKNAPVDGSDYEPSTTTIDIHVMNNTYQKEVGYIRLFNSYVSSFMNVTNNYNTSDNTNPVRTFNVIFKYQYHKFFRNSEE